MIRPGAEGFFSAQRNLACIEQVAEKFPAGRRLETGNAEHFRDPIHRLAGRHRARHAGEPLSVTGHQRGVGGQHGKTVARGDVEIGAQDHVAITVAVGGGAKIARLLTVHQAHQVLRVRRVRIRVCAAEIRQRPSPQNATGFRAQLLQDRLGVRTGNGIHRIEIQAECARGQQFPNTLEIEQLLHQRRIVGNGIYYLYLQVGQLQTAGLVNADVSGLENIVLADFAAVPEYRIGETFLGRPAIGGIELDAEVGIRAARIVTGR